jgi:hypothetical protein
MRKTSALFLAVIGLFMLGGGIALFAESKLAPALLLVSSGAGVLYWANWWDDRRENTAEQQRLELISSRSISLTKKPWSRSEVLVVKGSNFPVVACFFIWITLCLFSYSVALPPNIDWLILGTSVFASIVLFFLLLRMLPGLLKPSLELNAEGFTTPLYGMTQWRDVEGINLFQQTFRGQKTTILNIKLGKFPGAKNDTHWTEKILFLIGLGAIKRKVIAVFLNGAKDEPETIYAVARFLWKQSTGMDHDWNPMFSDNMNQALRRVHDLSTETKNIEALANNFLNDPEMELLKADQFLRDIQTIKSEREREAKQYKWVLYAGLLILLATIFWPVLRAYI